MRYHNKCYWNMGKVDLEKLKDMSDEEFMAFTEQQKMKDKRVEIGSGEDENEPASSSLPEQGSEKRVYKGKAERSVKKSRKERYGCSASIRVSPTTYKLLMTMRYLMALSGENVSLAELVENAVIAYSKNRIVKYNLDLTKDVSSLLNIK